MCFSHQSPRTNSESSPSHYTEKQPVFPLAHFTASSTKTLQYYSSLTGPESWPEASLAQAHTGKEKGKLRFIRPVVAWSEQSWLREMPEVLSSFPKGVGYQHKSFFPAKEPRIKLTHDEDYSYIKIEFIKKLLLRDFSGDRLSGQASALPTQGVWVLSLVRKLRSHVLHSAAKNIKKKKKKERKNLAEQNMQ